MARDDFSKEVKITIAQRAGLKCSNPNCRKLTSKPHTDPQKSISCGIAAHICAAAPGGPRYDPNQSPEERKDITNAMWLCHNCSDLVDKDEAKYTKEILLQWKHEHDEFISGYMHVPLPPYVEVKTVEGLIIPSELPPSFVITSDHCTRYRNQILTFKNTSDQLLLNISSIIQFPESIISNPKVKHPAGTVVICKPKTMELVAYPVGDGANVRITSGLTIASNYFVEIDKLFPGGSVEIIMTTIVWRNDRLRQDDLTKNNAGICLRFFVEGNFDYEYRNKYSSQNFVVRLIFDKEKRTLSSVPDKNDTPRYISQMFNM